MKKSIVLPEIHSDYQPVVTPVRLSHCRIADECENVECWRGGVSPVQLKKGLVICVNMTPHTHMHSCYQAPNKESADKERGLEGEEAAHWILCMSAEARGLRVRVNAYVGQLRSTLPATATISWRCSITASSVTPGSGCGTYRVLPTQLNAQLCSLFAGIVDYWHNWVPIFKLWD